MATKTPSVNKVLLILRTTGSGRELLQGALQYARTDPYCSVQMDLMPDALTPEKVAAFEAAGYSGILTSEIGMTDEVGIGTLGAQHFRSHGASIPSRGDRIFY